MKNAMNTYVSHNCVISKWVDKHGTTIHQTRCTNSECTFWSRSLVVDEVVHNGLMHELTFIRFDIDKWKDDDTQ